MSRNEARFGSLVVFCLTILISLLVAEGITRSFYAPAPARIHGLELKFSDYYQPDPELGWLPRANITSSYIRFPASFRTNSKGIRDREYDEKKPNGVARIVVVGDSHTWGYGVNDDELYSEKLESMLPDTEVINLGVTAYSLWQEFDYFKRTGVKYAPDILIIGFTQNDIKQGANIKNIKRSNAKRAEQTEANSKEERLNFQRLLAESSALYKFVVDRINTNKNLIQFFAKLGLKEPLVGSEGIDSNLVPSLRDYPPSLEQAFKAVATKLGEIKRFTEERGIRLIVVAIPTNQAVNETIFRQSISRSVFEAHDFDLDKPYRRLASIAADEGFEFVNPVGRFRDSAKNGQLLHLKRDIHLSPLGHEVLARVLADYISGKTP